MSGAVIFDLDGTLTVPVLDFDAIRAEIGIEHGTIMESIAAMGTADRDRAMSILEHHERLAAENSVLRRHSATTVQTLRGRGWPVGILTRNERRWAEMVLRNHALDVDGLHARDDGPMKPAPDGVHALCRRFGVDPVDAWMIGDHAMDVESGRRAGARTMLLADGDVDGAGAMADHVIADIDEVLAIVSKSNGADG